MTAPKSLLDIDAVFGPRPQPFGPGERLQAQGRLLEALRANAYALAEVIRDCTPNCSDKLTALEHVRQALFFAREAIELNEYTGD
jgi:hypothetical protein